MFLQTVRGQRLHVWQGDTAFFARDARMCFGIVIPHVATVVELLVTFVARGDDSGIGVFSRGGLAGITVHILRSSVP